MKKAVGLASGAVLFGWALAVPVSSRAGDDVTPGQEEAFMRDYLQMQSGPREMAVAVWYAEPIWEVMGEERFASINEEEKNELLFVQKMLRPFTVMLVVHGRPDGRGGVRFSGEKWMRKHATLVGLDGKKYKPLTPKNWPSGLDVLLQAVRFGAMSEGAFSSANNMHFIVFPNTDKDGKVIVDYRYPGSVSLRLGRSTLIWQTPIRTGPQKRAL